MPLEIFKAFFRRNEPEPHYYSHSASKPETYRSGTRDNRLLSDDEIRAQPLDELRERTHAEMEKQVAERIKNNPHPTEEEISMGAFFEEIEPQVRDAILTFRRKGYNTNSSGFGCGPKPEQKHLTLTQVIDGPFSIDENTKAKLSPLGVDVHDITSPEGRWYSTIVRFYPDKPDLNDMKQKWDQIAEILPDRGRPASPSSNYRTAQFRRIYAPSHKLTRAK